MSGIHFGRVHGNSQRLSSFLAASGPAEFPVAVFQNRIFLCTRDPGPKLPGQFSQRASGHGTDTQLYSQGQHTRRSDKESQRHAGYGQPAGRGLERSLDAPFAKKRVHKGQTRFFPVGRARAANQKRHCRERPENAERFFENARTFKIREPHPQPFPKIFSLHAFRQLLFLIHFIPHLKSLPESRDLNLAGMVRIGFLVIGLLAVLTVQFQIALERIRIQIAARPFHEIIPQLRLSGFAALFGLPDQFQGQPVVLGELHAGSKHHEVQPDF